MIARCAWIAAFAVLGLTACASSPAEVTSVADRVCVDVRRISSVKALDDRHVLVTESANDQFLFTVDRGCSGLSFALGISIAETLNRVCGDGTSWLSFNEAGTGSKRCRIIDIEPVADESVARALIKEREDARDE